MIVANDNPTAHTDAELEERRARDARLLRQMLDALVQHRRAQAEFRGRF